MSKVKFFVTNSCLSGFSVEGHSGYAERGSDIVCAAVSSATLMCANTITEILGLEANISQSDGFLSVEVSEYESAQAVLRGLELHLKELAKQYPSNISINY